MSDYSRTDSVIESHSSQTPRSLPCVYLFPPEEDEGNIVCVFPTSRPDPFNSTPRTSGDVFYQLPDALDDEEGARYGVSTYMTSYSVSYQGPKPDNRSRSTNVQSIKTLNKKRNRTDPHNAVFRMPNERGQDLEDESIFIPPSSRRSSVFEDRSIPPDPVAMKNTDTSLEESSSSFPSSPLEASTKSSPSLKEKAKTAFKTFRRPTLKRRKEPDIEMPKSAGVGPSHEEVFPSELKKKKNRRSLMSFLNSSSTSIINPTSSVESHTQNSTDLSSLKKGKSCTAATTSTNTSMPNDSTSGSQLVPKNSKLSRRRSITQIFSRKKPHESNKLEDPVQTSSDPRPPERRRSLSTPSGSETGDDEPKSPVMLSETTEDIAMEDDSDLVSTPRSLSRPMPLDMGKVADFSNRFSLHVDDNPSTDSPIMELAVQLNSLDFNHLDPAVYSDSNDDD